MSVVIRSLDVVGIKSHFPSKEFKEVLDLECIFGERINASTMFHFRNLIQDYKMHLKNNGINIIKYRANGGIYTVTLPDSVEFILEPVGNITVQINEPSKVLGYEKDFSEIRREVKTEIKRNLSPSIQFTPKVPTLVATIEEKKAIKSLRDIITEKQYRKYLTNGYILLRGSEYFVEADSRVRGLKLPFTYQIFKNRSHIKVYSEGKPVCELCIRSEGCPPTDHIINMKMMIENDEKELWNASNYHSVCKPYVMKHSYVKNKNKNLVDFYKTIKNPIESQNIQLPRNTIENVQIMTEIA